MNNTHHVLRGFVLRQTDYRESDRILTVLTDSLGKQRFLAQGARRKGSRIRSACEQLTYNEYTVYEYKNRMYVDEAETLEPFSQIREDLDKLSLASYFSELLETVADADASDPALLQLALNGTYALCSLPVSRVLLKAAFELRLMCLAGFQPVLEGCSACASPEAYIFSASKGELLCENCAPSAREGFLFGLSKDVLSAMVHICTCGPKRIFSFSLGEEQAAVLGAVTEAYVLCQTDRHFSTLDFYNSLSRMTSGPGPGLTERNAPTYE